MSSDTPSIKVLPEPYRLCSLQDLKATGSRSVAFPTETRPVDLMLVQNPQGVYAYVDRCPHAGAPLEWQEHEFLSEDRRYILCAMHGAIFHIHDGSCVKGPCRKQALKPLQICIKDDDIFLIERPE